MLLVIVVLGVLVGCGSADGGGNTAGGSTADSAGDEQKGALAMSFGGGSVSLWNDVLKLMRPMVEDAGYTFLADDPQWKVDRQVADWDAWLARGDLKALMAFPIQVDAVVPATKRLTDSGVPVLGFTTDWEGTSAALLTHPAADGERLATEASEWILENHPGESIEVAVLGDRNSDISRGRTEAMIKTVREMVPDAKVYELAASGRDSGFEAAKRQLVAHPDTTVWISFANEELQGAYRALVDSGIAKDDPNYFLGNLDVTNDDLDLIKIPNSIWRTGYIFTSREIADVNTRMLIDAAEGEPVEDYIIEATHVTAENADDFYLDE